MTIDVRWLEKLIWWPDLQRYGAKLSIADNPSAGRRFTRLEIPNREVFEQTSALIGQQLIRVLRDAGFVQAPLESETVALELYDRAIAERGRIRDAELAAQRVRNSALFFYSAGVRRLDPTFVRRLVPAFNEQDGREVVPATIMHPDFLYGDEQALTRFIRRVQYGVGVRFATFYLVDKPVDAARANRYRPLPTIQDCCCMTLGLDGRPLKAPATHALVRAFATRRAAVAAYDHGAHIEPVVMPHGLPIGTDDDGSLLVVRDGRWMEFNPVALTM